VRQFRKGSQVHNCHGGVGRGFGIGQHSIGVGRKGFFPARQAQIVFQPDHADTVARGQFLQEVVGSRVKRFLGNDGLATTHTRQNGGGDGCHAGGKDVGIHHSFDGFVGAGAQQVKAFEHGQLGGKLRLIGIGNAGIDVTGLFAFEDGSPGGNIGEAEG